MATRILGGAVVNKGELRWMIHELNEMSSVIKGYAQLALECDHPHWSKKYIASIIQQVDKVTALTTIISDLYLNRDDSCYKSKTLDNLIGGKQNTRFH
jgi:hypothetical protein